MPRTWSRRSPRRAGRRPTGARRLRAAHGGCSASRDVVAGRADELALLEALDAGRPVRRARDDVSAVAAHLRSAAGWADKLEYAGLGPAPRPVGVVGVLVTGALPAVVRAVAPALACGNVVVLVPDPDAPLGALVLAEAGAEAGLPDGVLNVLPAGVLSGDVDAVAVTGPPAFCRDAARLAPGRPFHRRATGGLVQVVHDDAPLDQAVDGDRRGARRRPAGAGGRVGRGRVRPSCCGSGSPGCASATRWTTTPTSARWPRRSSATGPSPSPRRRTTRAPAVGPAPRPCRSAGGSWRRRCSPTSRRRCGSPARRSPARCCRC